MAPAVFRGAFVQNICEHMTTHTNLDLRALYVIQKGKISHSYKTFVKKRQNHHYLGSDPAAAPEKADGFP
jgi:predicted RNA-binding protein with RPS1 domain